MVIAMLETVDFFEQQIKECHSQAARATNKADRQFWQRLADRWAQVLQAKNNYGGPDLETARPRPNMGFASRGAAQSSYPKITSGSSPVGNARRDLEGAEVRFA